MAMRRFAIYANEHDSLWSERNNALYFFFGLCP